MEALNCIESHTGKSYALEVIEYLEREPAAYIQEDGYLCEFGEVEFFVSLTGRVDCKLDGEWIMGWGVCPKLKNECDLMTAALDKSIGYDESINDQFTPEPGWDTEGRYHH